MAMGPQPENIQTWFLVFTEGAEDRWWKRWLRPGFRHAAIFGAAGPGGTVVVEAALGKLAVGLWHDWTPEQLAKHYRAENGAHIVRIITNNKYKAVRTIDTLLFPSCVSAIKCLTGIPFRAVTPFALYREAIVCYDGLDVTDDVIDLWAKQGVI